MTDPVPSNAIVRDTPAVNIIYAGGNGIGASFVQRCLATLTPPGTFNQQAIIDVEEEDEEDEDEDEEEAFEQEKKSVFD